MFKPRRYIYGTSINFFSISSKTIITRIIRGILPKLLLIQNLCLKHLKNPILNCSCGRFSLEGCHWLNFSGNEFLGRWLVLWSLLRFMQNWLCFTRLSVNLALKFSLVKSNSFKINATRYVCVSALVGSF